MKYSKNGLLLFSEDKEGILSKKCEKVTVFDNNLQEFTEYMFEMMKQHDGIGISANQLGISKQIFAIQIGFYKDVFINSSFEFVNNKKNVVESTEGCLSFPGIYKTLKRFDEITVKYQNLKGKWQTGLFADTASVVFQHEWNHGQGIHFSNG
jgi:peptide deformylase